MKLPSKAFSRKNLTLHKKGPTGPFLLSANHDDFKFVKYKMNSDENIREVALKKRISSYKILQKNNNINSYNDHSEDEILINNYYCKKIKIYVDVESAWASKLMFPLETVERKSHFVVFRCCRTFRIVQFEFISSF